MRKLHAVLFFTLLLFAGLPAAFAQSRTVSGKVADARGQAVVGATVSAPGTTASTQTNSDGVFSLAVPASATRLVVTSVGFAAQDVPLAGQGNVSVSLQPSATQMSEVVVTALGVERNRKSLQASVTTVSGEQLTQAREISVANALEGRVAGVNVSKIASGPGGSTRVVIRGAKTLGSNLNQPLYVVDGVPIDNSNNGQAGLWGGADQGDAMNSINPDDVASISVLKGASAAALYGSRAANGVILITTKKGGGRKGLGVEFNSNYVVESIQNLTDFQTTHGNGYYKGSSLQNQVAVTPKTIKEHWDNWLGLNGWGPTFDGSPTLQFDGITRPYSYAGDNWDRFYKTGYQLTNTIGLTGGSEGQNFRLSLSDLRSTGVFPNSGFDRINATLATNSKFGKRLTVTSKILYSNEKTKNRPNLSDAPGNANLAVYYTPGDVDIRNLIGDPNKPGAVPSLVDQQAKGIVIGDNKSPGEEFQVSPNLWQQNPYWAAYQFRNNDIRDRVIASGEIRYNITDFLYVAGQGGLDYYSLRNSRLTPQGTGYSRGGDISENENRVREVNLQYTVGFSKNFAEKFGINAFVGGNSMRRTTEFLAAQGSGGFNLPFLAAINNAFQRNFGYDYGKSGINSLFGSVELSYNNYLFITGTGRKDWFSTLDPESNSILYPSIGGSFVFTDALKSLPNWLSYGKLRAAWAQVGNANSVRPYQTTLLYGAGIAHLGRPLGGFTSGENFPNPFLKPFTSTEMEYGIEARFFKNRLGLDFTYYDQKTTDDILDANISRASGFATKSLNIGQISNKGIELLLTGTPVRSALNWEISLNLAKNTSRVVSLIEGQTQLFVEEPRTRTAAIYHIVGKPYGMIMGYTQMRDPATGLLVYDADGAPLTDNTYKELGNGVPDFTGGVTNSLTWKNVNFSFLIDFKSGGDIYSGTNVRMTQAGFTKESLLGREGEAPLQISGVKQDGVDASGNPTYKPFSKTLTPGEARNYWNQLGERAQENFVYDASFVKLRQITIGYTLPRKLLGRTPIQNAMISVVARNLAILHKNTPNIDPESTYSSSNAQGLDYFGMPATRTYGVNLRLNF